MSPPSSSLPLREAKATDFRPLPGPRTPKTVQQQKSTKGMVLAAAVVSVVILTALSRYPQSMCQRFSKPFQSHLFPNPKPNGEFSFSDLEKILLTEPSADRSAEWSYYYTSESHFPGEGKEQGLWTKQKWEEFGIPETEIVKYNATISTPLLQRLALINTSEAPSSSVVYEAKLMEELPANDPSKIRTPAFHGQSYSGNVTAQYVFANFGREEDYDELEKQGIDVKGKIVIVKNGMGWRGAKMSAAVSRGLVGLLMYSDPQQDGEITEGHGYKAYPDGPARPETCIERGSIGTIRNASAGNPSVPGESIPSLPVAFSDIVPLLKALHGYGPKAADMSKDWHNGGLYYKGVDYYAGPSPSHLVLNLNNQMSFPVKNVYQTFGTIKGSIEDEVIILGNHRDSWGPGAGDSVSGAVALMEVARAFSTAYKAGWKPRRTIMFVSWDGAEHAQVGSQPWIAENLPWLKKTTVAYLNVVVGAAGRDFQVKATPILQEVIYRATKAIESPEGGSVFDYWGGKMIAAGGGDAIPFLATACVPTSDLSFGAINWPYHSNFDTYTWMRDAGDPGWQYHVTTTKLWSMMAAYLSENPVLQISAADYAVAMKAYVQRIKDSIPGVESFDLSPLEDSIAAFHDASVKLDKYASTLGVTGTDESIRRVNQKYLNIERQFCYKGAHLVYEFSAFYTDPAEFPQLYKALEAGDFEEAKEWLELVQGRIRDAADLVTL